MITGSALLALRAGNQPAKNVVINEKNAFIYHNHYRRFIDINDLAIKINQIGLKILFLTEDINCAIFNNENYYFIRLIASL